MSAIEEREIDRLESELAALRADLDRLTKGTWSKEIARLSAANAALRQRLAELTKALQFYAQRGHVMADNAWEAENMDDTSEAPHWLCVADHPLMIEDGEAARQTLSAAIERERSGK
jgi:hypothetical protein